ncbi:hypothetical protein LOK49_LG15G01282 [Camellia lanceoleosa]|uniref:Uncharacterized protein n=1 Tax=Camellia lanceoleosa TaxID=1840588 RepID=A0ACC0F6H5_9ERIC|nr:hypothetical protein LOK49_LG15G01282 [Camellia lanceoleosa]
MEGVYKVKFDGAFFAQHGPVGFGMVIRDWREEVIASMSKKLFIYGVDCFEAMAALKALQLGSDLGLHCIMLVGDSLSIVRGIQSRAESGLNHCGPK